MIHEELDGINRCRVVCKRKMMLFVLFNESSHDINTIPNRIVICWRVVELWRNFLQSTLVISYHS